ncbi:MAG TPA: hypothetical protein VK470_12365 [Bacteroidota bacterium]|nr:hypothetical protein [Bacteroidota bacterium]
MITLENSALRVSILHPIADRAKLGPRFCTGAYIHQVEDLTRGITLCSGPEYPHVTPSVLNGQGMPEVFQHTLFDDPEARPAKKMIIGVGLLDNVLNQRSSDLHFSLPVEEFCQWEITDNPRLGAVSMRTEASYLSYAYELERTVRLAGRALTVSTRLMNLAREPMTFRWFAHPFFSRPGDIEESYLPEFAWSLKENPGFYRRADGAIGLDSQYRWNEGCYELLHGAEGAIFRLRVHPKTAREIRVEGDFPMLKSAIWANHATCSVEPFHQQTLDSHNESQWSMIYRF